MEKTSKVSREASDCKSPSWPRMALPTLHSSHPRPKGKRASHLPRICQANGDLEDDDDKRSPTSSVVNVIQIVGGGGVGREVLMMIASLANRELKRTHNDREME
ncbi:unnamed protein product [Sphenostylis stenocarpa]|uniref:Uncharacterized protein n=1 Tax=Sphenostylis stenocarpa TaxID=92480 RepID=A0AA86S2J3_9FABA|nr:unnamed protein product [Sphenostylis stenocarpa]